MTRYLYQHAWVRGLTRQAQVAPDRDQVAMDTLKLSRLTLFRKFTLICRAHKKVYVFRFHSFMKTKSTISCLSHCQMLIIHSLSATTYGDIVWKKLTIYITSCIKFFTEQIYLISTLFRLGMFSVIYLPLFEARQNQFH